MKATAWMDFILRVTDEAKAGNPENLKRLAEQLEMGDQAKQALRNKGYGWTGIDILKTAEMVENVTC